MKRLPRRPARAALTEAGLIRLFAGGMRPVPDVTVPPGDDTAVLFIPDGCRLVAATDHMSEGMHFLRRLSTPAWVAEKLALSNISDFAAMGARPRWALLNAACPPGDDPAWWSTFAKALRRVLGRHGICLIGGDTGASRHDVFLNLTLLGWPPSGRVMLRRGARSGDLLFVSGPLGGAAAGLTVMRRRKSLGRLLPAEKSLARRHFVSVSRLEFALELVRLHLATSGMDLSDGLAADLPRLCRASRLGAEIGMESLPLHSLARRIFGRKKAENFAVYGGEDYELMFTAAPENRDAVLRLGRRMNVPLREIGSMKGGPKRIVLRRQSGAAETLRSGMAFSHFGEGAPE